MSQDEFTPDDMKQIEAILAKLEEQEKGQAPQAQPSQGVPTSLQPPQKPLISMEDMLASSPVAPKPQPAQYEMPTNPEEQPWYSSFLSPEAAQGVYRGVKNIIEGSPEEVQARHERWAKRDHPGKTSEPQAAPPQAGRTLIKHGWVYEVQPDGSAHPIKKAT